MIFLYYIHNEGYFLVVYVDMVFWFDAIIVEVNYGIFYENYVHFVEWKYSLYVSYGNKIIYCAYDTWGWEFL